ncbi:MAG TPA: hypothetical protein VI977_03905 [archaeon]|nr:hypothetical protein [archaeon]
MQISYEEIRRIHRLEKNSSRLVEVEEDFFDSMSEFVKQQKEAYLKSLKTFSATKARDFVNLKKMVEEIFSMREKKLLNKALVSSRTGEIVEEKIAVQEKKTFTALLKTLNAHQEILQDIFSVESETDKNPEEIRIKILENIPSFVGADMNEYGPFEKDSVLELPEKVSSLLVSRKLAQKA